MFRCPLFKEGFDIGSRKANGTELKVVLVNLSTLSLAVLLWALLHGIDKHAHIYSFKLSLVLFSYLELSMF